MEVKRYFSGNVMKLNPLPGVIKTWGNPGTKEKIEKIKAALNSLKEELLVNVPVDSFKMEDLMDYLVNVFRRLVPEAPDQNIAARATDILKVAHIKDVSYKTILQRIYRRKQKRT
jgi:hypothetical protein